jgi:aminoglycoside phosphotransferase (APT) family kinase protein
MLCHQQKKEFEAIKLLVALTFNAAPRRRLVSTSATDSDGSPFYVMR